MPVPPRATDGRGLVVGRDLELAEIDRAANRLQRRQPQLPIELVGEAGIGKSTLLEILRERCTEFDAALLTGRASQFEQDLPFGPLLAALADVPEAAELGTATSSRAAHALVRGVLERIGRTRRTLLVIDDLHWADPATKDLVGALLERPPRAAVLIAVAYRDHQVDGPLPIVITSGAVRGTVRRIELGPLTGAATQQLLDASVNDDEVDRLRELCGGNPLLLSECARAVKAGTWQIPQEPTASGAPPRVADGLTTELLPLSPAARTLLDAAAVLGDPCDPDLAAAVGALDRLDADDALDELARADLLRAADDGRLLRFRHPLVREALHEATAPGWRRQAHARAATALTDAGAPLPSVAHHVARSAEFGDLGAAAVLTRAGREILPRSPASAADWLMAAWRLLPRSERNAVENQQLLYALSVALSVRGRGEEALRVLAEACATVDAGSSAARRLALGTAAIEATIGNHAAACRRLRAALIEAGDEVTLETLQMHRSLAISLGNLGELESARASVAAALRVGDQIGGLATLASRPSAAWLAFLDGDTTAFPLFETSAAEFANVDDALMPWFVDALATHVRLAECLERHDLANLIARGLRATGDGLRPILAVDLLCARGRIELRSGTLRAASDEIAAAEEEAGLLTDPASTFQAAVGAAQLAVEQMSTDEALGAAETALVAARAYGPPYALALAVSLLVAAQLETGAARQALSTVHTWLDFPELPSATPDIRAAICADVARAHLALGEVDLAAEATAGAQRHAASWPTPRSRRAALRASAALADAHGQKDRARELLTAAWRDARDRRDSRVALELQLDLAAMVAADGDRTRGLELALAAEEQLLTIGSPRLERRAARTLRTLGHRPRQARNSRADAADRAALTTQQRAVVERATAGRTNTEIAADLFLSVKTVESHLTAAYAKLGISSRRDLAFIAEQVRARRRGA